MANYLDFTGLSYYTEKLTTKISNDISTAIASLPIIISLEDNNTTKAGNWLAKTNQITSLEEGQLFLYKLTYAGANTTYLTITCSGTTTSKLTVYRYGTTKLTTQYAVGSYLLLYYTGSAYRVVNDYDANSYAYVRQYQSGPAGASASTQYALLARYNLTDKDDTYDTAYTRYHTSTYLDIDDGSIHSPAFYENGVALSSKYALSSAIPAAVTESTVSGWGFTKNTGTVTGSSLTNNCIIVGNSNNDIKASAVSVSDIINIANGAPKAYVIHANQSTNPAFNSNSTTIDPNGDSITTIDNTVVNFTDIRIGDVIYIIEDNIPDRWCSGAGSFTILETTKVDLSGYITTVKVGETSYTPTNGVISLPAYPTVPTNYVTTNTTQTISGAKTFTATDTIISGSGFSTTNNLLNNNDVYACMRGNSSNPLFGLKVGTAKYYLQATSSGLFLGPTSTVATSWDSSGNITIRGTNRPKWGTNNIAITSDIPSSVLQYTSQTLTDAQKEQARTNIGIEYYDCSSFLKDFIYNAPAGDAITTEQYNILNTHDYIKVVDDTDNPDIYTYYFVKNQIYNENGTTNKEICFTCQQYSNDSSTPVLYVLYVSDLGNSTYNVYVYVEDLISSGNISGYTADKQNFIMPVYGYDSVSSKTIAQLYTLIGGVSVERFCYIKKTLSANAKLYICHIVYLNGVGVYDVTIQEAADVVSYYYKVSGNSGSLTISTIFNPAGTYVHALPTDENSFTFRTGSVLSEYLNLNAPSRDYSMQIGEFGFTIDSGTPDDPDNYQLLKVDEDAAWYAGQELATLNGVGSTIQSYLKPKTPVTATSSNHKFRFNITSTNYGLSIFSFGNCNTLINTYGLQSGTTYKQPGTFVYDTGGSVITTTINVYYYKSGSTEYIEISSGNSNYTIVNSYTGYLFTIKLY